MERFTNIIKFGSSELYNRNQWISQGLMNIIEVLTWISGGGIHDMNCEKLWIRRDLARNDPCATKARGSTDNYAKISGNHLLQDLPLNQSHLREIWEDGSKK